MNVNVKLQEFDIYKGTRFSRPGSWPPLRRGYRCAIYRTAAQRGASPGCRSAPRPKKWGGGEREGDVYAKLAV